MRRMWQYQPFLSQRSLRRGLYSLGEQARMRRFVHKLLSGALPTHPTWVLGWCMCRGIADWALVQSGAQHPAALAAPGCRLPC